MKRTTIIIISLVIGISFFGLLFLSPLFLLVALWIIALSKTAWSGQVLCLRVGYRMTATAASTTPSVYTTSVHSG